MHVGVLFNLGDSVLINLLNNRGNYCYKVVMKLVRTFQGKDVDERLISATSVAVKMNL